MILIKNRNVGTIEISENEVFDPNIEYKSARIIWPDTETLRSMFPKNIIQNTDNFSMKYRNETTKLCKTEVCIKFVYITVYF